MPDETTCRFCAETVLAAARKCRHCGEWLSAGAGPPGAITWAGDLLVVGKDTLLPDERCWVCGTPQGVVARRRQFVYTPPWVYIGLLGGLLPLLVLALIGQRKGTLNVPTCGGCRWRSVGVDLGMFLLAIVGIVGLPAGGAMLGNAVAGEIGLVVGLIVGFAAIVGAVGLFKVFVARRTQITCERIEGERITLRVPRPDLIREALAELAP